MAQVNLLTPLLEGGIRNTNFFNGRLLTAEDLRTEQEAHRRQRAQLGRAIGPGVVEGLAVELIADGSSNTTAQVRVAKGLGINSKGQALELPSQADVSLRQEPQATTATDAGLFATCEPPTTNTLRTSASLYVLVLSPASDYQEQAPMSGLAGNGSGTLNGCGYRYAVEGVRFRMVLVNVERMPFASDEEREETIELMNADTNAAHSRLRNRLAHLCFGTDSLRDFARDPYDYLQRAFPGGLLDWLRSTGALTDCDVPLALIFWQPGGVRFIDQWAVRRAPNPAPTDDRWPLALGLRPAHSETIALQFQEQTTWMLQKRLNQRRANVRHLLRYLPAAGIVPVVLESDGDDFVTFPERFADRVPGLLERASSRFTFSEQLTGLAPKLGLTSRLSRRRAAGMGFFYPTFFEGVSSEQIQLIDGDAVSAILQLGLTYRPIDLETEKTIQIYFVRENWSAVRRGGDDAPGLYVVYANREIARLWEERQSIDEIRDVVGGIIRQPEGATAPTAPTTAIRGVGPRRSLLLAEAGIQPLDDLAQASVDEVAEKLTFSRERAINLIQEAQIQIGRA